MLAEDKKAAGENNKLLPPLLGFEKLLEKRYRAIRFKTIRMSRLRFRHQSNFRILAFNLLSTVVYYIVSVFVGATDDVSIASAG